MSKNGKMVKAIVENMKKYASGDISLLHNPGGHNARLQKEVKQ